MDTEDNIQEVLGSEEEVDSGNETEEGEDDSYEDSSEEMEESSEGESEAEEEEPKLKYKRLDAAEILKNDAANPDFSKKDTQQFVSGGLAGQLILNEKGWFGQKQDKVLQHSGEGPIYAARWKGTLIAYANDEEQNISGHPPLFAEVNMILNTNDYIVCGLAPFGNMTLILAYLIDIVTNEDLDDSEQRKRHQAKCPELRILNSSNDEISIDALPLHGYAHYQANDYVLDYFPSEEDMFYVVSPKDLVLAKPRDSDDHVGWLLDRFRYEEALVSLQEAQAWGGSKVYNLDEIGEKYLMYLVKQAAENCKNILKTNKELWEKWIFTFSELKHLKTLYETIRSWPSTIYTIQSVIEPIEDVLEKEPENKTLMECLAELYAYNREPEKALEYNLRLRRPDVFDLIRTYNLFSAVQDKVILLMDFDQHLMSEAQKENETKDKQNYMHGVPQVKAKNMPAVQLLIENTDSVQVELYAEYDYQRLIEFLRASNYYTLDKAFEICKQRDLVPEMVFILGRMGNNKQALMLIIERLGEVQRAIDFAKEQDDDILWEDLLRYSLDKPPFITGLLENLGNISIDPIKLLERIPDGLEIVGLKQALIKVLQDFNLQASLREGCQTILVSDSVSMACQLHRAQKRGISCG
ncbi:7125_t:CDS:10, partial [Racocetra fulgida]